MITFSTARPVVVLSAALLSFACASNKDNSRSDTASMGSMSDSAGGAMAGGQDMGGMQHDSGGGMSGMSNMTGNADQDFLRMMSDHHKGMIEMAHEVKDHKSSTVIDIATKLDTKQDKELDQIVTMLERDFKDQYSPKVMPDNKQMADELTTKTGADFDKAFLEHTIMHHQQAIKMVDAYLPKAKNATVKQMAEKIKADQTREISELQQRVTRISKS